MRYNISVKFSFTFLSYVAEAVYLSTYLRNRYSKSSVHLSCPFLGPFPSVLKHYLYIRDINPLAVVLLQVFSLILSAVLLYYYFCYEKDFILR